MAQTQLEDRTVAILATNGYEFSELDQPLRRLRDAGAAVKVVAPEGPSIRGWANGDWADSHDVDLTLDEALEQTDSFDGLVIPGGVINPDKLRLNEKAVRFARSFFRDAKPVSAICHGPQLLIECGVVEGRELTSYPSLKTDLENAGATWVDREVVCDQGLTTSRGPADLDAFITKTIEELKKGKHAEQRTL